MLGRALSLVAALLIACASTGAHGYARPLQPETAHRGFATAVQAAHRDQAHVTPEAASENSPATTEASDGRRFYAKARYYGAGRAGFLSVDPWDGDPISPVSLNKYLYGYVNPGVYIDPDGRIGFLTDLRDRFDQTDVILRQQAVESEGTTGLLGYSLLRGLAAAGSAIPRALNVVSDAVAQALPGEAFSGVRADGAAQFGNAVDAGVYLASNPGQVARDVHSNAVRTTTALAEGDRGAASDAISFLGQVGGGAAAARFVPVALARNGTHIANAPEIGSRDIDLDLDPPRIGSAEAQVVGESASGSGVVALDPRTARVFSVREARRLDGENRGAIFVQERTSRSASAADFESTAPNAFSDVESQSRAAPALRFNNPNSRGNNFVRFDGYEDGGNTLVDRKTQLTTKPKQISDLRRVSEAAAQNPGYQIVYEFPSQEAAASARRILAAERIRNIEVRVAPQ